MSFFNYDAALLNESSFDKMITTCTLSYQYNFITKWYKHRTLSFTFTNDNSPICAPPLLKLDKQLMDTKKEIDEFHHFDAEKEKYYNQITRFIDPFAHFRKQMQPRVFPAKAMTNAWLKCWEIIHEFQLLPQEGHCNVFCNAELPGAFIYAIHHYIQTNTKATYDWVANSLYPSDGSILGDEFGLYERYKDKWLMTNEKDNNGDVTNPTIIEKIRERCQHKIDLYTSDIGIGLDYSTFEKQEQVEALLQLGQLLCGLSTLRKGGHLVCKQFMFFSPFSMSMMYLASQCFEAFTIFKPQTSRPANSEMYIIGKGFKGFTDKDTELIYKQLMELLLTWNDKKEEERMNEYIVPLPEHAYLTMYLALHRIYNRQIQYIKNNIATVCELYPSPATFHTVKAHYFFKSEQQRLREWIKRFDIPYRDKGQIDL
jgi:hypothetical protein